MDLSSNQQCLFRCESHLGHEIGNSNETLVDGDICVSRVFIEPLIGIRVGAKDKFQVVPFEAEADGAIE